MSVVQIEQVSEDPASSLTSAPGIPVPVPAGFGLSYSIVVSTLTKCSVVRHTADHQTIRLFAWHRLLAWHFLLVTSPDHFAFSTRGISARSPTKSGSLLERRCPQRPSNLVSVVPIDQLTRSIQTLSACFYVLISIVDRSQSQCWFRGVASISKVVKPLPHSGLSLSGFQEQVSHISSCYSGLLSSYSHSSTVGAWGHLDLESFRECAAEARLPSPLDRQSFMSIFLNSLN